MSKNTLALAQEYRELIGRSKELEESLIRFFHQTQVSEQLDVMRVLGYELTRKLCGTGSPPVNSPIFR